MVEKHLNAAEAVVQGVGGLGLGAAKVLQGDEECSSGKDYGHGAAECERAARTRQQLLS